MAWNDIGRDFCFSSWTPGRFLKNMLLKLPNLPEREVEGAAFLLFDWEESTTEEIFLGSVFFTNECTNVEYNGSKLVPLVAAASSIKAHKKSKWRLWYR